MTAPFVPDSFGAPTGYEAEGFRLEPLGPEHNERDHEAWMSSIDHIRSTPGMGTWEWPQPMTLEENLADLVMHANEFAERSGFTYSILDGDDVIGCVYIYPDKSGEHDAKVMSWVRASRAEMDSVVWSALSDWFKSDWPFRSFAYAPRG